MDPCFDGKNHLRDKLSQFDTVMAELVKYRTALAVTVEAHDYMSVMDQSDFEELSNLVLNLLDSFDMSAIRSIWQ